MGTEELIHRQDEIVDEVGWAVILVMPAADDPDGGTCPCSGSSRCPWFSSRRYR
ncbi:hypothetical protein [Micromonospora sp. NPDC005806]|uniref:hypothetical protein n=1 Tax=Micromonospora sp. NPDC005806 TaxID=3364234 RepID=UPI0036A345DA